MMIIRIRMIIIMMEHNVRGGGKMVTDTSDSFFYDPDVLVEEAQTTYVQARFDGDDKHEYWETDITIYEFLERDKWAEENKALKSSIAQWTKC